jgi:hypothetical protein
MTQFLLRLAATMVCLSAGVAFAEVVAPPRPTGVAPSSAEAAASKRSAIEAGVADCERMWDRGTHMTKKEWSVTCRRVQNRIQQLELR